MWFKKKKYSLGLDIGEHYCSFVVLCCQHKLVELIDCGRFELGGDIRKMFAGKISRAKNVAAAVSFDCVTSLECDFSSVLNECDIETELRLNSKKYFPQINEELMFDFMFINDLDKRSGMRKTKIFAMAVEKLFRKNKIVKSFGLKSSFIEIDNYAILRVVRRIVKLELSTNEICILLIPFNEERKLIVFNNDEALSEIKLGRKSFDENEVDFIMAKLQEAKLYFKQHEIKKIIIIDILQNKNRLTQIVKEQVRLDAIMLDPFAEIKINNIEKFNKYKEQLITAFGLALRGTNVGG